MAATLDRRATARPTTVRAAVTASAVRFLAVGIAMASAYGLLAEHPYRNLPEATLVAAKAQDVCSVVVAGLLLALAGATTGRAHVVRLGLLAYVAYSYAIYLIGVPMNRFFLGYVVIVSVAGALLLDGLVRLRPSEWPRTGHRRLERGTGWMLLTIGGLFAALWLSVLVPYTFGGQRPSPEGPGGVAYPVFVLDLVVVLPCVAAVGVLLLQGRAVAGPLALVVLVKIITLFGALWVGVFVGLAGDADVHLGADAGPSAVMLVASVAVLARWWPTLPRSSDGYVRPEFWDGSVS